MTGFTEKNGVLHADDIALPEIARKAGTPTYIYSATHIRAQYTALSGAMKKALPRDRQPLLCYACKANSHIAVLKLLNSLGSSIEVVSEGELLRALKAGFDPAKIVSEGVGKSESEIAAGLKTGIHQFNIESLSELEKINRIAGEMKKTASVILRLNPDVGGAAFSQKTSTGGKGDKFGLSKGKVFEAYRMAKNMPHVKALGLFTHIGSQVSAPNAFRELFDKIAVITAELRKENFTVERLDIGGGFPILYNDEKLLDLDTYAGMVRDIIAPLETEIILEPGRFLVGNAGALLTEVLYIKEAEEQTFLVIDAAMNDLIRPAMYDAWHTIEPVENRKNKTKTYDVVGPICESSDIFARGRQMPEMKEGDLAALKSAGAYGMCMASNYNTRRLPAEVLVDGGKMAVIRQRQSYEDIIKAETIPDWLK